MQDCLNNVVPRIFHSQDVRIAALENKTSDFEEIRNEVDQLTKMRVIIAAMQTEVCVTHLDRNKI